jgi:hypothetical protein
MDPQRPEVIQTTFESYKMAIHEDSLDLYPVYINIPLKECPQNAPISRIKLSRM